MADNLAESVAAAEGAPTAEIEQQQLASNGNAVESTEQIVAAETAEEIDETYAENAAAVPSSTQLTESDLLAGFREQDNNLIDIINSMEADRKKFLAHVRTKISCKETEFEKTKSDNDRLKARIAEMELCLRQNNIDFVSAASTTKAGKRSAAAAAAGTEDILTQAKALLFEKTKICKQQEQQLAAMRTQVEATKEVLTVTKEMLCLRNIENDHTQARLETFDLKLKNERARQALTEKKLEVAQKSYADLRAEYDLQSSIFKQLRATYECKIEALTKQLAAAKS